MSAPPVQSRAPLDAPGFAALAAQGHNRIALVHTQFCDLHTPLALYRQLVGDTPLGYLLESVVGGERFGRYSFIGLPAARLLRASGQRTELLVRAADGSLHVEETHEGDPLAFVATYRSRFKPALTPDLPRFCGGLAGTFGYDVVRHIEPRLQASRRHADAADALPELMLLHTDELAVVDNLSGRLQLIVWADPQAGATPEAAHAAACARLAELVARLASPAALPPLHPGHGKLGAVQRPFERAAFEAAVRRAKEFIAAGDCMQVVLAQPLMQHFAHHPLHLYRALRSLNPSPYLYYYDLGEAQIVGASPEILTRVEARDGRQVVAVRPIAGTRPRGATPAQDSHLEAELRADAKERAEHLMLIDLARNDIGRVCEPGSVRVTESFGIERYSHVMHLVSHVEGVLKADASALDVLRATFPAGTLSGAPKVRAMELIDELEVAPRGVYGGAVGYWSYGGEMDLAIAIRTGVVQGQRLTVQAGAGIVADSDPAAEWRETEAKARAVLAAAEWVERGLG